MEELGEDAYREWNTGMLVPAGPGCCCGETRSFPLFTSWCYNYCFVSLCVVCQDRISFIPGAALELETPLLPLPSGWSYRGTSPPPTAIEQLLPQRRNKENNSHSQAPLPKSSGSMGTIAMGIL